MQDANTVAGLAFWICLVLTAWDAWEWREQRRAARALAEDERARVARRMAQFVGRRRDGK